MPASPRRWDDRCCETEEWQRRAGVGGLRRGPEQPFYHVLVDQRDWAKGTATPDAMLAYVAEEMLTAPEVHVSLASPSCNASVYLPAGAVLNASLAFDTSAMHLSLGSTARTPMEFVWRARLHDCNGPRRIKLRHTAKCQCPMSVRQDPATWVSVHGSDDFRHPYSYLLFLGTDSAGDLMPARQLRDKYSAPRREVYPQKGDDEEDDKNVS